MTESLRVRIITREEQEEKYKKIVYLFVVGVIIVLLYLSYNYIRTLGFIHESAIALMISIPLILLIFIFKGKKVHWSIKSLSQDQYHKDKYRRQNRKGFFWLIMVLLLILIIIFLQFYPSISNNIKGIVENSKTLGAENSFIKLANQKGYPKSSVLSNVESKEICSLKCGGNLMSYTSDTPKFYVIECDCGRKINSLDVMADLDEKGEADLKQKKYYLDLKTLEEITREEFLQKIGK